MEMFLLLGCKVFIEVKHLQWEDISFTSFQVAINQHIYKTRGKCSFLKKALYIPLFNMFKLKGGLPYQILKKVTLLILYKQVGCLHCEHILKT